MHHNDPVSERVLLHGIRIQFLLTTRCLHLVAFMLRKRP